jgi:hypothetical protein
VPSVTSEDGEASGISEVSGAVVDADEASTVLSVLCVAVDPPAAGSDGSLPGSAGVVEGSAVSVLVVGGVVSDDVSVVVGVSLNAKVFAECIVAASNNPPITAPATRCFFVVLIILFADCPYLIIIPGGEN